MLNCVAGSMNGDFQLHVPRAMKAMFGDIC
jgi:hypothetical protein